MINYERLYEYRFRDVGQPSKAAVWAEIATFMHEALGHPRRLLDPAAGGCEFINAAPSAERWAVDEGLPPECAHPPRTSSASPIAAPRSGPDEATALHEVRAG